MKKCPKCGCEQFIVSQHVTQTVLVDGNGMFLKELLSCDEVTHSADDVDLWECNSCGLEAAGAAFNVNNTWHMLRRQYQSGKEDI